MLEKINKKKLAAVILAGVITIGSTTSVFASYQPGYAQAAKNRHFSKADAAEKTSKIKSAIESLVTAGTITREQADAVIEAYTTGKGRNMSKAMHKNPFDKLVAAGTITQAQADAIADAAKAARENSKNIKDILNELVAGGTITQNQADTIINAAKSAKENRSNMGDVLKGLVAGGTITQEQADAAAKIFTGNRGKDNFKERMKNPIDKLAASGTITQEQSDAIRNAIKSAMNSVDKK